MDLVLCFSQLQVDISENSFTMATPWSWRLDPHPGSSASLGPAASARFGSTDPLTSLSHGWAAAASDEIFWQDFRPTTKRLSRRDTKVARLHRFDSDDEHGSDRTVQTKKEADALALEAGSSVEAESEEEDAIALGESSSEESHVSEDIKDEIVDSEFQVKAEGEADEVLTQSLAAMKRKRGRPKHTQADTDSSIHVIARAIHKHASANSDSVPEHIVRIDSANNSLRPLTYKETVRLVRLISMLFRFPKSSRRIVRRRHRPDQAISASTFMPSLHPEAASMNKSGQSTSTLEQEPKSIDTSSSCTHRPRILAKVHPDDASPNSPAVLKLIALIPAALPARVHCTDWIVELAVQARRDEYGNILLPNSAYTHTEAERDASVDMEPSDSVDTTAGVDSGEGGKITRSMRQRLGKDAPSIPLPKFWRRPTLQASVIKCNDGNGVCKTEEMQSSCSTPDVDAEGQMLRQEEAEVYALVSPATDQSSSDTAPLPSPQPARSSSNIDEDSHPPSSSPPPSSGSTGRRAVNLSKLVAKRMREKRQAKTLLLRTHQSLRRRMQSGDGDGQLGDEETDGGEIDEVTLKNTIANSSGSSNAVYTTEAEDAARGFNRTSTGAEQETKTSASVQPEAREVAP